jgi:hypothetical protein
MVNRFTFSMANDFGADRPIDANRWKQQRALCRDLLDVPLHPRVLSHGAPI